MGSRYMTVGVNSISWTSWILFNRLAKLSKEGKP